ncbi:cytochrome-c peroxidase [Pseudoalteromonas sp. MTN2-4]|uniref:cytochrome-c peroxidase n=1 Tax=Pseudoalteromonas sp. MTN2-4 TaxID=3056555 RepID=UPI0036F25060
MHRFTTVITLVFIFLPMLSLANDINIDNLRKQYLQPAHLWPKPTLDEGVQHVEIGLILIPTFPQANPFSKEKVLLGEKLFHDPRLSRSGQIACASCHDRDLGWADGRAVSFGHDRLKGRRNAPSIENSAFWQTLFWDGRAASLEEQALMPILDPVEMNFSIEELEQRLNQNEGYKAEFKKVFNADRVKATDIAKALATYQRTILSRSSDFDYFIQSSKQKNEKAKLAFSKKLSDQALWGLHLFRTKARCMNCHSGPLFSDNKFHNLGLTWYKRELEDLGRFKVTKQPDDVGKFKTPSLRGVMNTKPWMHNGSFANMEGILNVYNAGGFKFTKDPNDEMSPVTSKLLKPLNLNYEEMKALEAFLHSITASPARGPHHNFYDY